MTRVRFDDGLGSHWDGLSLNRFHERLRGWLGREVTPQCQALLIAPCRSVHFWGMGAVLDVIFVQRSGQVHAHYSKVSPGSRPLVETEAWGVFEIPSALCPALWSPAVITWRSQ